VRSIGSWIAGVALAVLAVGLGVAILGHAAGHALARRAPFNGRAGGGPVQEGALDLAERVRVFVVSGDARAPSLVAGQPGFDAASVAHLEDVRSVLSAARIATVLLAIGVGLWIAATIRMGERSRAGFALKVGAAVSAGLRATCRSRGRTRFLGILHGIPRPVLRSRHLDVSV